MNKVLIIDDALFMRKLIRQALEPFGFEINEAENGLEGINKFNEFNPDVTTLDIVMPEMDGLEVLKRIRDQKPNSPVVMITAVDQRESMLKAMKLGVTDFIVKPFDEDRVISAVEKAIQITKEMTK
ncbi:MAG: response regulator [Desulfobacterales bacterium]|nr:response regulator [Desulfobacterales bacterium]